jgi:hypothetical protein
VFQGIDACFLNQEADAVMTLYLYKKVEDTAALRANLVGIAARRGF